ncbi:MAG: histidinol-phosphatase HisJ family protein [Lachnospiraceae bacterium]|nr:histidinol-phosphatase HisJ family protein [Lachnospiraceae bacterium]
MPLLANYHTHTTFCDGTSTAEEQVRHAVDIGFKHLGFSGHMDPDIHMQIEDYYAEIGRLRDIYADRIEILCGVELDNLYDPGCADRAEYVIGSTHFLDVQSETPMSVDNSEEILAELCRRFFGGDYYAMSKAYYELEAGVYDRLHCTFVGHFDLITRFNDSMHTIDEANPRYYMPALEAMEYLVSKGIPFEINCGAVNRGRKKEFYPNTFLLRNLRKFGGEILINSDAHHHALLNGGFDAAVRKAVECGFTHTNILTKKGSGKVHWEQVALDSLAGEGI